MYQILRLCPIVALGLFLAVPQGTSAGSVGTIGTELRRNLAEGVPDMLSHDKDDLKKGDLSGVIDYLKPRVKRLLTVAVAMVNKLLECILVFVQDVSKGLPNGVMASIKVLLNCINDSVKDFFQRPDFARQLLTTTPSGPSTKTAKKGGKKFPTSLPAMKMPTRGPLRPEDRPKSNPISSRSVGGSSNKANAFASSNSNSNSRSNTNSGTNVNSNSNDDYFPNGNSNFNRNSNANSNADAYSYVNSNRNSNGNFFPSDNSNSNGYYSADSDFDSFANSDSSYIEDSDSFSNTNGGGANAAASAVARSG